MLNIRLVRAGEVEGVSVTADTSSGGSEPPRAAERAVPVAAVEQDGSGRQLEERFTELPVLPPATSTVDPVHFAVAHGTVWDKANPADLSLPLNGPVQHRP